MSPRHLNMSLFKFFLFAFVPCSKMVNCAFYIVSGIRMVLNDQSVVVSNSSPYGFATHRANWASEHLYI